MPKKITKNGGSAMKLFTFGASLAGLAATAYFFLGPKGRENQKQAKSWAIKMKGDVVEKLELARNLSESAYHEIIDSVAAQYEKERQTSPQEIRALARDLKKHWQAISSSARRVPSNVVKGAGQAAKKRVAITKKSSPTI